MKLTTYEKTTEIDLGNESGSLSLATLISALRVQGATYVAAIRAADTGVSISAGEEREATGEDIYSLFEQMGGTSVVTRDEDGVITAIHATVSRDVFEYESGEIREVLESLQATAPAPAKLTGDLAQTSVGVPGSGTEQQVIGLSEWTIDWKRKTADATTTDNSTYESSLPSTASWSVKAKYMFIDQDTSQQTNILATLNAPSTPPVWNFFPTVAQGRAAFSGAAYVDGITIASGMGKCVGLDVSLKGTGPLNILTQLAPVANSNTVTGEQAED